jgi:dTDP-D-glucose 4,6-dehydratase
MADTFDDWEARQAEIREYRRKKQERHQTFVQSYAASDADYGMDGQSVSEFIDWLQDAYQKWPDETIQYIVALTMNNKTFLDELHKKAYTREDEDAE